MLLLSLLLPPLIISLPQSISKLSYIPSGIKSAVRHFRGSPTTPGNSASPVEGIPELNPEPSDGNIIIEPLKPTYQPLIYTGKDAWRTFLEDPVGSWEKGDRDHVWFFWFSGVDVTEEGEIAAPLIEETEWPAVPGDEEGEFELRRRKLEVGMFQGSHNDEVYRDTAIGIAKQQQQTEWEQEKEARLSASSASKHTEPTSVDQIIFSSDTPTVTPSSYAHFAFVNCNDEEEKQLCYRFLAIEEHRPMLYAIVRNTTIIEPKSVSSTNAEPEVAPLVPEFVHMGEDDSRLKTQSSDDSVINVEIEEKDIFEDPIVEEVVETELPSPPEPTIVYKLLLRKVPLKENLTITDLHNFYEFKRWEKLPVWDDPLNPADGFVGTAMEGKVGEFIGIGYEYWYKMPKWVLGMSLGLLLRWITVTIIDRNQQKRERKKALRAEKKLAESAAASAPQTPLKTQAILPNVPKTPEIPVKTQAPEEIEVVEHAELAKAEEVASIAEVLGKGLAGEKTEIKPSVESNGGKPVFEADEGESVVEEDVPVVETSEDRPVAETSEDGSVVDMSEDEPVAETSEDGSVVDMSEDGPVAEGSEDGSVAETSEDGSVAETSEDGSVAETSEDGSVVDMSEDGPVVETNTDKPVETDADKRVAETNGDKPIGFTNDDRSFANPNNDKPVVHANDDRPVVHTNDDKPVVHINDDEPVVHISDDEPVVHTDDDNHTNEDTPVIHTNENGSVIHTNEDDSVTNGDSPVDHTNWDSLAGSMNDGGFEVIDSMNESIMEAKDGKQIIDAKGGPVIEATDDEPVTEVKEEKSAVDMEEDEPVVGATEDKPIDRANEDEPVIKTPEVKPDVNISPVRAEQQVQPQDDKNSTEGL